jgi:hypothetical protein
MGVVANDSTSIYTCENADINVQRLRYGPSESNKVAGFGYLKMRQDLYKFFMVIKCQTSYKLLQARKKPHDMGS